MTVRSSIWIGDIKHDFGKIGEDKRRDCVVKMKLQILKSQGSKPKDSWLIKNPTYAAYWERL